MKAKRSKFMKSFALFLLVFLGFLSVTIFAIAFKSKKEKVVDYEVYVNQVINQFVKEMKNEYDMKCEATGGGMSHDVEEIGVDFAICKKVDIKEARWLEVAAVEKFLKIINSHEKLRPFLREYPFKSDRTRISISFHAKNNAYFTDGSVVYVHQARNNLYYYRAESVSEKLIDLYEESYETALKIVNESKKK